MAEIIKNPNAPKKGDSIAVDPIQDEADIKALIKLLDGDSRNSLLFILGINTGIRVTDILQLRVGDLKYLNPGQVHQIVEGKTNKKNVIVINKSIRKALDKFIEDKKPDDRNFLFQSAKKDQEGQPQPITVGSVNKLIKTWTKAINLKIGNYGARTLRKTWGYQQRVKFGVGFEVIAKRYNHSSPAITMRYLGIQDKEVHDVLMNEIG